MHRGGLPGGLLAVESILAKMNSDCFLSNRSYCAVRS